MNKETKEKIKIEIEIDPALNCSLECGAALKRAEAKVIELSRMLEEYKAIIAQEKAKRKDYQKRAEEDDLTGLRNKNAAREQIEEYLNSRKESSKAALLVIDLDNFKQVNDGHGHLRGDEILVKTAEQILAYFRSEDIVGRIGGDEFLVLMKEIRDSKSVQDRCGRLIASVKAMVEENLPGSDVSCSVGIAYIPDHGADYESLFKAADQALYHAKARGKNQFSCYEAGISDYLPMEEIGARMTDIKDEMKKSFPPCRKKCPIYP